VFGGSRRRFVTLRCALAAEMISSALRILSRFFLAVSLSESTGIRLSAVFRQKTTTVAYPHVLVLCLVFFQFTVPHFSTWLRASSMGQMRLLSLTRLLSSECLRNEAVC